MDGGAVSPVSNRNKTVQPWRYRDHDLRSESRCKRLAELILFHHKPGCAPKAAPCRCWRCHTGWFCALPGSSETLNPTALRLRGDSICLSSLMISGKSEKKGMFVLALISFQSSSFVKHSGHFLLAAREEAHGKRDRNESHFIAHVQCSQVVLLFFTAIKTPHVVNFFLYCL